MCVGNSGSILFTIDTYENTNSSYYIGKLFSHNNLFCMLYSYTDTDPSILNCYNSSTGNLIWSKTCLDKNHAYSAPLIYYLSNDDELLIIYTPYEFFNNTNKSTIHVEKLSVSDGSTISSFNVTTAANQYDNSLRVIYRFGYIYNFRISSYGYPKVFCESWDLSGNSNIAKVTYDADCIDPYVTDYDYEYNQSNLFATVRTDTSKKTATWYFYTCNFDLILQTTISYDSSNSISVYKFIGCDSTGNYYLFFGTDDWAGLYKIDTSGKIIWEYHKLDSTSFFYVNGNDLIASTNIIYTDNPSIIYFNGDTGNITWSVNYKNLLK